MEPLHIGVTGSRNGMTYKQRQTFTGELRLIQQSVPLVLHHGDCRGVDEQACDIAHALGIPTEAHPAGTSSPFDRAHTPGNQHVHPVDNPITRNKTIVYTSSRMYAFPNDPKERLRSGTWATIRITRKAGVRLCIIYPDGNEKWENQ